MAQFEITFDEYVRPMDYDDYDNNQSAICGDDAQLRDIEFNTSADFSLGYNYTGDSPDTITILGYSDVMEEFEVGVGSVGTPAGFVPSTLQDGSFNNLTYPYTFSVANLSDLYLQTYSSEMLCEGDTKYYTERTRTIGYFITDINGNVGPTRRSTLFQTTQ